MQSKPLQHDVVGWGRSSAPWARPGAPSVSSALALALHGLGIRHAFGVLGGGIAAFAAGLADSPIQFFHLRHEAGAGFAAIEAHFASDRPTLAVVTTGPGLFNILNPMMAARMDGAKVLLISGFTSRSQVGRGAVQETSLHSMPSDLLRPGSIFHDVAIPETPEELPGLIERLQRGFSRPGGWVVHVGLPMSLQTRLLEAPLPPPSTGWRLALPEPSEEALHLTLDALLDPSALLWVGFGARRAGPALRRLAEAASLPVVTSPRAKGVFPEGHPLCIGVSGAGGSPAVKTWFATHPPKTALVVGTRLGEVTSFLAPGLAPRQGWIQVDIDAEAFGMAFPQVPGLGILADAGAFFEALLARMTPEWREKRLALAAATRQALADIQTVPARLEPMLGPIRPPFLIQALQDHVVEASELQVLSEAGTSFTWCNAGLRFEQANRYRTSAAWGSMGHFTTGCVGAALVTGKKVVTVVGDGAMLMNNELNSAAQYGAQVVWIVLNDSQLGLNFHGMLALGMRPIETQFPRTDFVAFARSQGADGVAVRQESELADALAWALAANGPVVVDVHIDPSVPSPVIAERVRSLAAQASQS